MKHIETYIMTLQNAIRADNVAIVRNEQRRRILQIELDKCLSEDTFFRERIVEVTEALAALKGLK